MDFEAGGLTKGRALAAILVVSGFFLFTSLQLGSRLGTSMGSSLSWSSGKVRSPGARPLDEKEVAELLGRAMGTTKTVLATTDAHENGDSQLDHVLAAAMGGRAVDESVKPSTKQPAVAATEAPSPILILLQEIEREQLLLHSTTNDKKPVAVIRGSSQVMDRDLPMYRQGLERAGFEVQISEQSNNNAGKMSGNNSGGALYNGMDWTVLLCMAFNDGDGSSCMLRSTIGQLKPHQKISRIPGIRNTLWKKDALCRSMMEARHLSTLVTSPIAPLCWSLPTQYEGFAAVISALGGERRWVFKPLGPAVPGQASGPAPIRVLSSGSEAGLKQMQAYQQRAALAQELVEHPLLVDGFHVSIRAYVLVTSASPLRVYWHQEGLVYFRQDEESGFKKIQKRRWFFAQLRQYLARHHGDSAEEKAFSSMEQAIVKCLLVAESSLSVYFGGLSSNPNDNLYRCDHCFQLLGVDLILNNTLDATVIEINGQPDMRESTKKDGWASNTIKATAIEEMMRLLFSREDAAPQLSVALEFLKKHVGLEDISCHKDEMLCLTREDLEYMLATVRQNQARGNFIQIYPSASGEVYNDIIKDLSHSSKALSPQAVLLRSRRKKLQAEFAVRQRWRDYHDTSVLHATLMALEHFFEAKALGNTQQLRDLAAFGKVQSAKEVVVVRNVPAPRPNEANEQDQKATAAVVEEAVDRNADKPIEKMDFVESLVGNVFGGMAPDQMRQCVKDPNALRHLSSLAVSPGKLLPEFSATNRSYQMTVANDITLVSVSAQTAHCRTEFRLNSLKGTSKPFNWSLSVGDNYFSMLVVSMEHTEPWIVNKYLVNVHRQSLTEHEPRFEEKQQHEVCYLPQDCDLRVYAQLPCGIIHLSSRTWSQYIGEQDALPMCSNSYSPGRWVLPCTKCTVPTTCFWREAKWLARECRYAMLNREKLNDCMRGKKLLFIGDSTVRGMMFSLIEKVNGSLQTWNKAHSIRSYRLPMNVSLGFSYYPQFWLPKAKQPVFDRALHLLLRGQVPLANDGHTVLVLGGVQWLSIHHIEVVSRALSKAGLDKVTVVVKLHGSGFNQPIEGVIYNNLAKNRKLLYRHRMMLNASLQHGFIPIDTFSMTLPRHKHYLYGRCACHFHTVVAVDEHENPVPDVTESPVQGVHYHIEGPVNAFYTDMMALEICRRDGVT